MRFSFQARIDAAEPLARLRSDEFWTFAAEQWHRLYAPYVPRDTGRLYSDVRILPGEIEHLAPYAAAVYEGRFSASGGGRPSRKWDRAAEASRKGDLVAAMQRYVDAGRLKLGG